LAWLWAAAVAPSPAVEFPSAQVRGDVLIDIGSMRAKSQLGHGWSLSERTNERDYRWIKSMEADVAFTIHAVMAYDLYVEAAPAYLAYRRQSVAVFVNGRYVAQWLCHHDVPFAAYRVQIPARFLRAGVNLLTFRMGYRTQSGFDPRELALCVDRILLRPAE
jgi:hypothetical protein